jgi:bifunctional DNA-binding transcriptional regulator/antitoxin component of YhaV-PrlF toxin-antitoxin module
MLQNERSEQMKTVEYIGRVLVNGHLEIPTKVRHELQLRPNTQVKVILMREEETAEEQAAKEAERAEVWRQIDALRDSLSGKDFNLTDSLLQDREAEDNSL